jgi:hypothetical protein
MIDKEDFKTLLKENLTMSLSGGGSWPDGCVDAIYLNVFFDRELLVKLDLERH